MGRTRVKGALKRAVHDFPGEIWIAPQEILAWRGRWSEYFGNEQPIRVEVGAGRGRFLADLAARGEAVNLVGIELKPDRCVTARRKIIRRARTPFVILCTWVELLPRIFGRGELDRIYINFPDPWPTSPYRGRRMYGGSFLHDYLAALREGGEIWFKSDHAKCYEELLAALPQGLVVLDRGCDMHSAEWAGEQIVTEYERRYLEAGRHIHYVRLARRGTGLRIHRSSPVKGAS